MDLHYSQTGTVDVNKYFRFTTLWIYTILKPQAAVEMITAVSLPYGFTLFSNVTAPLLKPHSVSLPYGFTLFSNLK